MKLIDKIRDILYDSKAIWLLDILKEEGVFSDKRRISVIDEYINETY